MEEEGDMDWPHHAIKWVAENRDRRKGEGEETKRNEGDDDAR